MHFSSRLRLGIALCGPLLLSLLSVAVADAAPSHPRVVSRKLCGARQGPCRVKAHPQKSLRQPAHYFVRVQRLVRRHPGSGLERSLPDPLREKDEAALQDRTAVSGEDDLLLASLEPLGVLASLPSPITVGAVVPQHSPRGPPAFPGVV